jgi:hypothetical protein
VKHGIAKHQRKLMKPKVGSIKSNKLYKPVADPKKR